MKILVVEDSPTMRNLAKKALNALGYTDLIEAEDGVAALKELKSEYFDLVITDWNMPKMNGMELIKKMREDTTLCNIPIIITTARGQKDDIIAAAKAKVSNYIVKPYTVAMLKQKIDNVLEKSKYYVINIKLQFKSEEKFFEPQLEYVLKTNENVVDTGNSAIRFNFENASESVSFHGLKPGSGSLNLKIKLKDKNGDLIV